MTISTRFAVDFFIDNKPAADFYSRGRCAPARKSAGLRRIFDSAEEAKAAGIRFLADDSRLARRASFKITQVA